jgi:hypothetical protein
MRTDEGDPGFLAAMTGKIIGCACMALNALGHGPVNYADNQPTCRRPLLAIDRKAGRTADRYTVMERRQPPTIADNYG